MTRIATNILALVEFIVMLHVLLHGFPYRVVLVVVHDVGVSDILCMDTATALY